MMKYWRKVAIILVAILLVPLMPVSVSRSASALTESQLNMFSQNNIFFYDPSGGVSSCVGDNRDYDGGSVWGSDDLAAVEAHRQFYERAAEKYGFPWQIMAVIHYREHSLIRSNPDNGQGVYQLFSYTNGGRNENAFLPAGPISDSEFQRQSDIAAMVVAEKAAAAGVDLKNMSDGDIQKVFYYYNGTAGGRYYERAIKMGLSEEDANNGGGSPYVMNKYDAMRDPDSGSVSPYWIGTYSDDNKYNATAVERRYGAYVLYAALTGGATCSYAGGSIAETALMLSWDGYRSHDKDDPKPEYVEAMKAVGAYQQGNGYYPYGASCDQFVGTVMRYSGADTEYPIFGPERQKNWMDANPSMYEKIEANGDFTMLQPGDIFVTVNAGRHIYLYVGEIGGEMTQASASANDRTGEHYSGVDAVYFTDGGLQDYGYQTRYYEVYRRVDFKK